MSKRKSRLYLCPSEPQSQLLTFRLNEEPHLMWDYRTSNWDEVCSLWVFMFSWNIRLLKTSQAQLSRTWEKQTKKKNQRISYSCYKDKTLQTSSMVWCSSVRRFCFCSLRRTRTETRCEGWNVSFLISCFQGTREREDNGQMRGRMIAAMTKLGLITHRGQNDDWHQWFQSTDASLKYKLSPPSRTGGSFKPHRMGFPKCPCRVRARKAQLNQRQITHKCCWVKSNLKDACKTTAFASASRFWIRNMLCILFMWVCSIQ